MKLPDGIRAASASPVDLRGEPERYQPFRITGGELHCTLGAYAPMSFLLN